MTERRSKIQPALGKMSVRWQCRALKLCRGIWYYQPRPMDEKNLELMDLINLDCMDSPFYGRPNMTAYLRRLGHLIKTLAKPQKPSDKLIK